MKLFQLGFNVLVHPSHSPELALSDYYLFGLLQNGLDSKTFTSMKHLKNPLNQFFNQKFYECEIKKIQEIWRKIVIEQNRAFNID